MHNLLDYRRFSQLFPAVDSIAYIGNAPNILNYMHGQQIDDYQLVVRFNQATVNGYETLIGSRTDILCVNVSQEFKSRSPKVKPNAILAIATSKDVHTDLTPLYQWAGEIPLHLIFSPDIANFGPVKRTKPFTTGTYGLAYLNWLLEPSLIYLSGFNYFSDKDQSKDNYWHSGVSESHLHHEFFEERQAVANYLSNFKGVIRMTPEVSKSLSLEAEFECPKNSQIEEKKIVQRSLLEKIYHRLGAFFLRMGIYFRKLSHLQR